MKKIFAAFLFTLMLSGLVTTAVSAANCQPGCDCSSGSDGTGLYGEMQRRAEAMRVRDKAYNRQVFKQSDNTLGMTCYDRALAMTARLGTIFSDVAPSMSGNTMPPNDNVFGGSSSYPTFGIDNVDHSYLILSLQKTLVPIAQDHASDFSQSISAALGATSLGLLGGLVGTLQGWLNNNVFGTVNQINGAVQTVRTWLDLISAALDLFGTALPTVITGTVNLIISYWGELQSALGTVVQDAVNVILQFVSQYFNILLTDVYGLDGTNHGSCDRIAQLWGKKDSNGQQVPSNLTNPLTGGGLTSGTPYFNLSQLLNPTSLSGIAGSDLLQSLNNDNNGSNSILQKALRDVSANGGLSAPGNIPSWPRTPSIPANATSDCVIKIMRGQTCP